MAKILPLGQRLPYPITISKILKTAPAELKKRDLLFEYTYTWKREVGDTIRGDGEMKVLTSVAEWRSPVDGKLIEWCIGEGTVIQQDGPCIMIEEACGHDVQFKNMCAICGKDMTEKDWAQETLDGARAPINMMHDMKDRDAITVSADEAAKFGRTTQRRLLEQRKLSLVVDLDQTVIHTCVEKTIGEWKADPTNPNHEAVKDIVPFQLTGDENPEIFYYVKTRPGLKEFLATLAEKFEMHVYTMGTRQYALAVAKIVDPEGAFFKDRVISRDESRMGCKSLQRLFPSSTDMVVIIDDRSDVWPRNRANLIKVSPYDFYKGIGDINSSFLPKRQDVVPSAPPPQTVNGANPSGAGPSGAGASASASADADADATPKVSPLEELTGMGDGGDPTLQRQQMEEQEKSIEKQITEQPLLHMQEQLDKEDEQQGKADDAASVTSERQHVLHDDDDELTHVKEHLLELHGQFYNEYDKQRKEKVDLTAVPDVGYVLDELKSAVLRGVVVVLSGLVPLGQDVLSSDIGRLVMGFGADLDSQISRRVTHLIVSSERLGTQKLKQAVRIPSIKIVNHHWLFDCISRWRRLDETPYLVDMEPPGQKRAVSSEMTDADTDTAKEADAAGEESHNDRAPRPPKLSLTDEKGQRQQVKDGEADLTDDADADDIRPHDFADGSTSPIDDLKTFDWDGADDELAEFLGSDAEDEEDDGEENEGEEDDDDDSDRPTPPSSGTKRKADPDDDGSEVDADGLPLSPKKIKTNGNSPLRAVMTPGDGDDDRDQEENEDTSQVPTPNPTGNDMTSLEDDLEAELLAELEAGEKG